MEEQGGQADIVEQVDEGNALNRELDQWVGFSDEDDKDPNSDSDAEGNDTDYVDASNATGEVSACNHFRCLVS